MDKGIIMKAFKLGSLALLLAVPAVSSAADLGKLYQDEYRVQQSDISGLTRNELRLAGMRMFTNPFLKSEGYGDGDDYQPTGSQGERGTLQGNGTFQRIGGLDAQTCLECHSIISRRTVPMKFGIGGVGGVNNTVLGAGGNTFVNLTLSGLDKRQNIDGRVINPPFIFGAGGIELLANEMTTELQAQLAAAPNGATTNLTAKNISFGSITKDSEGNIELDQEALALGEHKALGAEGTEHLDPSHEEFMVVAPFGRKGDEKSTRTFDIGALSFHFGMNVNPIVHDENGDLVRDENGIVQEDPSADPDLDGEPNEVTQGELSALSAFVASAQTPFQTKLSASAKRGKALMDKIACTVCHVPSMETTSPLLGLRFPEVGKNPSENVYRQLDMTKKPMSFAKNNIGGITVPLFADLKRHYMGESLAEFNGDAMFTTMRLWGVADTAPYLHDGRALTITDAIVEHGADESSEAHDAVQEFNALPAEGKKDILAFLDTLRSPNGTFPDLDRLSESVALEQGTE